jgi:hypothetical protein
MTSFVRATAFASAEVDVPAEAFWKVLRDWPGVMKWAIGEDPPAPLIGTALKPGHHVDVLPCTRVCSYDTSQGFQPFLEETLLHADPQARRIYYNIEGVMENGMRNYHATTFVDELGPTRARITCSSSFDVPDEQTAEAMRGFLDTVYRRWVIAGIATVAQQELAA